MYDYVIFGVLLNELLINIDVSNVNYRLLMNVN